LKEWVGYKNGLDTMNKINDDWHWPKSEDMKNLPSPIVEWTDDEENDLLNLLDDNIDISKI